MSLFSFRFKIWAVLPVVLGLLLTSKSLHAQQSVELQGPQLTVPGSNAEPSSSAEESSASNAESVSSDDENVTVAPSELSEKSTEKTVTTEKVPAEPNTPERPLTEEDSEPALEPVPKTEKEETPTEHADPLLNKVEEAIDLSRRRILTANVHTPWQIMHGILAYRDDFEMFRDSKSRELINAIEFISNGPVYDGQSWFLKTPHGGKAHPFTVPYAFEGHPNQFPAIMTMTDLPLTHEFKTANGVITMEDIVRNAQKEVNSHEGQTWTLWFLTHYLPCDTEWRNARGEAWSIERLVQMQNQVTVEKAACGGCHNLLALAISRNNHLQEGGQLRGVWLEANQKVLRYTEIARRFQNRDGSFSSDYFRSPKFSQEFKRRIATSGHILEFLMVALPQSRLNEPWLRRGIENVADDLIRFGDQPADVGALYHAVDALVIYRERMLPQEVATTSESDINLSGTPGGE